MERKNGTTMKKGDLSRFVDEAVRRQVFDLTVEEIKKRNADADQDELMRLIDEAVEQVGADSARH